MSAQCFQLHYTDTIVFLIDSRCETITKLINQLKSVALQDTTHMTDNVWREIKHMMNCKALIFQMRHPPV